jgi:hypothetical protein
MDKYWKLKLKYNRSITPYKHYTLIVPVIINEFIEDFSAKPGTAYIGMKVWATDTSEAIDIIENIGNQTGTL